MINFIKTHKILLISLLLLSSLFLFILYFVASFRGDNQVIQNIQNTEIEKESPDSKFISYSQVAKELIDKECMKYESNLGITECVIELLDKVAAEREWKQSKIENIDPKQINIYEFNINLLEGEKLKFRQWRESFEEMRDKWCVAVHTFIYGSGSPSAMAYCKLGLELNAIGELNKLYYEYMMEYHIFALNSEIKDFEPVAADIEELVKTNKTIRGCVWLGDPECEE